VSCGTPPTQRGTGGGASPVWGSTSATTSTCWWVGGGLGGWGGVGLTLLRSGAVTSLDPPTTHPASLACLPITDALQSSLQNPGPSSPHPSSLPPTPSLQSDLRRAAHLAGHPEWGHGGPHDAGHYNSKSWETGFFVSQARVGCHLTWTNLLI